MLRAIAFGLGFGAAVQAWRAWPPQALVTPDSLALLFCVGMVVAFFAGRNSGRQKGSSATATATATAVSDSESSAVATNSVQLAVFMPGHGAGAAVGGVTLPTEAAPWIEKTGAGSRPELTLDQLEGMDLSDLLAEHDTETRPA